MQELRQNGLDCERNKLRSSGDDVDLCYVEDQLKGLDGPFIAASDYMRTVADQIRQWIPGPYYTLGTDGFGRSDSRQALRQFFEVDAESIAYTSLRALYEQDKIDLKTLKDAAKRYKIDISKPNPVEV